MYTVIFYVIPFQLFPPKKCQYKTFIPSQIYESYLQSIRTININFELGNHLSYLLHDSGLSIICN